MAGHATWRPAKGIASSGPPSHIVSARDLPSQTKLKTRELGQGSVDELKGRDFARELLDREERARKSLEKEEKAGSMEPPAKRPKFDDSDEEFSSSSDSDEDDADELMKELERIRNERALERERQEIAEAERSEEARTRAVAAANPLVKLDAKDTDFSVKRRWDDDVVFRNQAREEKKYTKRFINDTIRNDFHRSFMHRYVK